METPQTLLGADGRVPLASMIHGGAGRVSGLHFGTYDYTASLGILGTHQDLRHPVADLAKGLMMLVAAETGVRVSDGSDNRIPVGAPAVVEQRWARHADGVLRALRGGIFQGWDLHPAQLPTRFAATFAFFRDGWAEAAERLGELSPAGGHRRAGRTGHRLCAGPASGRRPRLRGRRCRGTRTPSAVSMTTVVTPVPGSRRRPGRRSLTGALQTGQESRSTVGGVAFSVIVIGSSRPSAGSGRPRT